MINHMPEVAKMLGVELCEEFEIVCNGCISDDIFFFTEKENVIYNVSKKCYEISDVVIYLLTGITTIKRKPWKPNKYCCYFFVDTD